MWYRLERGVRGNPSVGITTVLVVLLAWTFGLNQVASQSGAHAMSPLHVLLFAPFIHLGVHLFHTRQLPLSRRYGGSKHEVPSLDDDPAARPEYSRCSRIPR